MSTYDPTTLFPDFYGNETIRRLAETVRWSVSDKNKRPLDLRALFDEGVVYGAKEITSKCLVTLDEITARLPTAATVALHLDSQAHGVMVLDIEPKCPEDVRQELLRLPNIYSETSMSGNGYHLVLPIPANFAEYPIAAQKIKLQEEHGWYEILMYHWCTFTRKPIPAERFGGLPPAEPGAWEALYARLASTAKQVNHAEFDIDTEEPEIEARETILRLVLSRPYRKTVRADFHGDESRWEFGMLGHLVNCLTGVLKTMKKTKGLELSESDKVWLLYRAAEQAIPTRKKHLESRNGYPFLFDAARNMVSLREADEHGKKKTA